MKRSAFGLFLVILAATAQTAFAYDPWVRDVTDPCPTYEDCTMDGDGDGGGSTPTTSSCLKCVIGLDNKSYCKDPNVYTVAQGEIVSPCKPITQCYWLGSWECHPTCEGNRCLYI
jgi:hypothetical protein